MRSKAAEEALTDILQNIQLAFDFVEGKSFGTFCADRLVVYGVTRCLEIISEASRRLPASLKQRHPNIPWKDIAGAGNVYRHNYDNVIEQFLWNTIQHELEPLRTLYNKKSTG